MIRPVPTKQCGLGMEGTEQRAGRALISDIVSAQHVIKNIF